VDVAIETGDSGIRHRVRTAGGDRDYVVERGFRRVVSAERWVSDGAAQPAFGAVPVDQVVDREAFADGYGSTSPGSAGSFVWPRQAGVATAQASSSTRQNDVALGAFRQVVPVE
jgi:hypothetical protein